MSDELKPCPFCGGEKINVYPQTCRQSDPERDGDRAYPMAQCRTCFTEVAGENFPRLFGDTSSAIAAWNTRADLLPVVKPLVWGTHPAGLIASNNVGGAYIIDTRGNRPRWLKWPGGHGPDLETVEEMQAAAQADYEARIRDCLDMTDPADEINRLRAQLAAAEADKMAFGERVRKKAISLIDLLSLGRSHSAHKAMVQAIRAIDLDALAEGGE